MDALATSDESPAPELARRSMKQARVPRERCRERPPVTQIDDDGIVNNPGSDR